MPRHLVDWIAETPESVAARLEAAREAQRQTRFTLGLLAVISMMMLILAYNAYLSFDSRWILDRVSRVEKGEPHFKPSDSADTVPDVLTIQALQDWAESRNATIELLGIRVSVDDAPVLGTTSLFVVSLWLLLVTRRENHTVGSLLRDTDTPHAADEESAFTGGPFSMPDTRPSYSNGQRWLIFHSIMANSLFMTFDRSSRIDSLRGANPLVREDKAGVKATLSRLGMSFARDFFFWFPAAASFIVFALDRLSYFQQDPFEPGLAPAGAHAPWFFASALVFIVCWVPLLVCCRGSARYSRATGSVLRDYGQRLQSDLLRRDVLQQQNTTPLESAR